MVFNYIVHMSTLKYFKHESTLPSPFGSLSKVVSCEGIKVANKEVNKVVNGMKLAMKLAMKYTRGSNSTSANTIQVVATQVSQGPYERFTPEEKA